MPVQGNYGGLPLPVPVPPTGQPVGDPALYYLLSYLQAVINAQATTAWRALVPIQPGTTRAASPVNRVFPHNPEELSINERDFPALFLWREEGESERIADDYRIARDTLHLVWIWPTGAQENERLRRPFVNTINKLIDAAFAVERDPSWVVPGDTDPDAARLGSLIYTWAGLAAIDVKGKWKLRPVTVNKSDETATYHALLRTLVIEEVLQESGFAPFAGISASLDSNDDPPLDLVDLLLPTS